MDYYELYSTPSYASLDAGMSASSGAGVWAIIALIIALVGGVLTYFLFVKAKSEPKNKFLKWLKDFLAFKTMWIEPALKMLYYFMTIYVVLSSFALIGTNFLTFLLTLIIGPVLVRLLYELTMIIIMIWRNTTDLAKNSEKKKA